MMKITNDDNFFTILLMKKNNWSVFAVFDDERWYLANIIFLFLFLGEESSRKLESST